MSSSDFRSAEGIVGVNEIELRRKTVALMVRTLKDSFESTLPTDRKKGRLASAKLRSAAYKHLLLITRHDVISHARINKNRRLIFCGFCVIIGCMINTVHKGILLR